MTRTLYKVYVTFTLDVLTEMHMYITQTLFAFVLAGLVRGQSFTHNAPDNRGTEFVIGYMENLGHDIEVELFITTMRRKNVSVEISAPHFEAAEIHHLFNVSYGMVKQVHFPNTIRVIGSTHDKKGILIKSDDEIVIYGVNKEKFSSDAFLGLPVDVLGTDYYIMTYYPPTDQCELLIVGVENSTAVTVFLGDALGNYTVEWNGNIYRKGDEIHINLNRFDTFQLVSKGDLSGTRVTSDRPVSVFSGNKKTKIGRGFSSDHIVEHLMPVTSWGKKFVTVPIPHRTVGDYFRFIASEDDTEIKISGGHNDTIFLKKAGDFAQKNIPSHAYCLVTSNKAIFVAQFVMSQPSRFEPSDPSMIIIPPVEQFASDYTFATPKYSFGSYLNYFLFIIKAEDSPGLRLNGKPFPKDIRFNWIPGTGYVGGFISIPEGSHNVRHVSPISIFGGYLYGRASLESYGFPTGMRMAPINRLCEPTPTVAGDGLDNDCDGLIDEELCVLDNEDNDEDGKTNEDCAMPAPVDGNWTEWQNWGSCSATCRHKGISSPTAFRTRRRSCTNPAPAYDGDVCEGEDTETSPCLPPNYCPVDGHWSSWEPWGHCSLQCKRPGNLTGTTYRHRDCSNPPPQYGGKQCEGRSREEQDCTPSNFCPVDGKWSSWGEWTPCSVSCLKPGLNTNGVQMRSRSCANPKPEHGGKGCPGDDVDIKECYPLNPCPVHGKWTIWEEWTPCSVSCLQPGLNTNGVQMRSRSCANPKPEYGGKDCSGDDVDIKDCSPTNPCPVDGNWSSWEEWTPCSVSCLEPCSNTKGVHIRSRSCANPKPEHGGKYCQGENDDMKECSPTYPCPGLPDTGWSAWSLCSVECGGGIRRRHRLCDDHSESGCQGDTVQEDMCNTQECVGTMIELETKQQTPPHFKYTELRDYGYQPNSNNSIVFHVKACSDAHVALSSNDQRVYEVIIGGWSNTKSIIRSNADGEAKTTHNGALLSCSVFKTFHVSWKCGVVVLHRNTSHGWVKVMEWQDPSPNVITSIAFTTGLWATGLWRFRGLAMCNCLVSGDPHYTTFDGEQIDFMGTCKYMLSEYKKSEDMCSYAVEVKNERRGSNSKVSFTRLVDVKMFGQVIRLHQHKNVYIDGQLTYLPYTGAMFEVVMSGTYVRFSSKCGVVVEFDGESNAWVRVPSQLGGSFTGICGNCNGLKDDRRDVEEFQVADDSDLRFHHCTTDSDFNPCSQQLKKEAETQSVCKYLNPANADTSPFKTCIENNPDDAMLKFESCVYDFCAFKQEANGSFNTRLCDDITAFADSCLTNGYKIRWRSAELCPLHCGEHAKYNPESSACPPTCIDPEAPGKCTLGTLEGCECEHGFLLSNRKCVKASECGCLDENGKYYPIGAIFSADCATVKQCKIEGEDIKLVVVGTRPGCGRNAECGDNNGQHTCVCKRGYQGDPSHSCHPVYECRSDITGTSYQGTVSQTASGNDCLPWNTSDSSYKSIGGHRFCRNPNQRLSPWCYIQTEHVTSWEYCDIPMCYEEKPVCETTTEIICSSSGDTFRLCHVEKAKYITYIGLIGSISTAECRNGFSFGRFGNNVWTDHGCGGYFEICFTQKSPVYNIVSPPKTECKQTQSGEDYKGQWGRTLSGRVCQRWNSQYPHNNTYSTSLNSEVNYCRNPGDHAPEHIHSHPWCYTTDENVTWEYCSIPNC